MSDFFDISLLSNEKYDLDLGHLLLSICVIVLGFFSNKLIKKLIKKKQVIKKLNPKTTHSLISFVRLFLSIVTLLLFLLALDINLSEVGKFELIKTAKFTLKIYHLFLLLIIILGTRLFLYFLEIFFSRGVEHKKIEKGKGQSIFQIIKYFIWIMAITLFIDSLGISITIFIASLSALLVGLGLGIQHFFNDVVSGIVLLFDHSIKVGDVVEVQNEMIGKIEEINLRTSKIVSREDVVVIMPNSKFTRDRIINWTHNSQKTRFSVFVRVAYGSDIKKVQQLLVEVANEHAQVTKTPKPLVLLKDFAEWALYFELQFYTYEAFRVEPIKSDLRFAISEKFKENGIIIPYPRRDLSMLNP